MKLQAVFDSIIVKKIPEEESTYGSIIVPDMGKQRHIVGDVVAVGPGKSSILSGELIPTRTKIGERVILPSVGITELEYEDGTYIACDEGKILAKVAIKE